MSFLFPNICHNVPVDSIHIMSWSERIKLCKWREDLFWVPIPPGRGVCTDRLPPLPIPWPTDLLVTVVVVVVILGLLVPVNDMFKIIGLTIYIFLIICG